MLGGPRILRLRLRPRDIRPAWRRPRLMQALVNPLAARTMPVHRLPSRRYHFDEVVDVCRRLDAHRHEAVKVAPTCDGRNPAAGGEQ